MGFLRLGIVLFIGLTILYLLLRIYGRSLAKERLEKHWDAGRRIGKREDFVRLGLQKYEKSARKRMLILIYAVPFVVISVMIYVLNFG